MPRSLCSLALDQDHIAGETETNVQSSLESSFPQKSCHQSTVKKILVDKVPQEYDFKAELGKRGRP